MDDTVEQKFDALIENQVEVVRRWQRATLFATEKGKDIVGNDPLWTDLRLSLSIAVDKLATLISSRADARR